MYKLYGKDKSEKIVHTNTDRNEHIKSGFYSETKPEGLVPEMKKEPDLIVDVKKLNSKPKKRKGI